MARTGIPPFRGPHACGWPGIDVLMAAPRRLCCRGAVPAPHRHPAPRLIRPGATGLAWNAAPRTAPPFRPPARSGGRSPVEEGCGDRHGTAPLARGRLQAGVPGGERLGNSPARAGKTRRWRPRRPRPGEQPRSHGDDTAKATGMLTSAGTAPLARGQHFLNCGYAPAQPNLHSLSHRGAGIGPKQPERAVAGGKPRFRGDDGCPHFPQGASSAGAENLPEGAPPPKIPSRGGRPPPPPLRAPPAAP